MTAGCISHGFASPQNVHAHTLSLDVDHGGTHVGGVWQLPLQWESRARAELQLGRGVVLAWRRGRNVEAAATGPGRGGRCGERVASNPWCCSCGPAGGGPSRTEVPHHGLAQLFACHDIVDLASLPALPPSHATVQVLNVPSRSPATAIGMPPLPARPNSLCLFCAFAARPQARPPHRLPRILIAHRSDGGKHSSATKTGHYNPLRSSNPLRPDHKSGAGQLSSVRHRLAKIKVELEQPEFRESLQLSEAEFEAEWTTFERAITLWIKKATPELVKLAGEDARGKNTLSARLRYLFYAQACGGRFTSAELENQKEVADLRFPAEWYPATREVQRTVHLHVGPTNSGKTYHALQRLEQAETGIYLGPLRLLAHEVYTRLVAKGKPCALITGEEQRRPEGVKASMFSCTVEMAPLNTPFEVAVIDEIQMISHQDRGWAWTQAFLGLQAKEVHLCGEARTVPLMRELCALVGDKVIVHEYKRLTPLKVAPRSLKGKLQELEKGDCIVAFTVLGIHALRREIEMKTGKKCAIVYGSLPPETRAQQARLFNDPDNEYDYLVASDAIGMGLNLYVLREPC